MSSVVRDLLRERIRKQRRANMLKVAEMMVDAYQTDPELTMLTALDSEDILDAPQ